MKKYILKGPIVYLTVFLGSALIMTVYETTKELIFKETLTPWQSHTITILVTSFLATFSSVIIRSWSDNILKTEQLIKLQQQKVLTLSLILKAVHHIVNNFLNHFQLIKLDMLKTDAVENETLEVLDSSIKEVVQQLRALEELQEPDKEDSYRDIYPK